MRVAHFVNSLTKASGISAFCANMTQHLAELGVDIDLYVWWVGDDALLPDHKRIKVYETKDTGFQPAVKPDIVHIHALWEKIAHEGCVYARKEGIPYAYSSHGMLSPWALRHKWWKKLPGMILYQYGDLRKASLLHATAIDEVSNIRRLRLKQDVAVVPLGTEMPSSNSDGKTFGEGVRTVLFLARVHPVKGLENLFNAWAAVKQDWTGKEEENSRSNLRIRWRLVIAGPDAMGHKEELLQLAQSLRLTTRDLSGNFYLSGLCQDDRNTDIVFAGPVYGEDKKKLQWMADLMVLPSFSENFGAVVSDSLAYGVPVITTKGTPWFELEGREAVGSNKRADVGSLASKSKSPLPAKIASTGRCGWWIDIGVEPLVSALREAMNMTDQERRELGENGRRLVEEKYTWQVAADKMREVYKCLL